jgi:ribosomal protein L37AE/L43A
MTNNSTDSTKKPVDLSESSVRIWSNDNCSRAYAGDAEKRVTSQQVNLDFNKKSRAF